MGFLVIRLGFLARAVVYAHVSCWVSRRFPTVSVGFRRISGGFFRGFPVVADRVSSGFTRVPMATRRLPMVPTRFPWVSCKFFGSRRLLEGFLTRGFD